MTSTYGDGEAPSNATGFAKRFKKQIPEKKIKYAVVGFGSKSYPKFCQFAENIDDLLYNNPRYQQLIPLFKINNQNENSFKQWQEMLIKKIINPIK